MTLKEFKKSLTACTTTPMPVRIRKNWMHFQKMSKRAFQKLRNSLAQFLCRTCYGQATREPANSGSQRVSQSHARNPAGTQQAPCLLMLAPEMGQA